MNTLIIPRDFVGASAEASAYLNDTPFAAKHSLEDAMTIYRNEDSVMRDTALEAIVEGRAAFWTITNYHDAIAYNVPYYLNADIDIDRVLAARFARREYKVCDELDKIVPLNMAAATVLSSAYARQGAWRDEPKLLARAKRDVRPRPPIVDQPARVRSSVYRAAQARMSVK